VQSGVGCAAGQVQNRGDLVGAELVQVSARPQAGEPRQCTELLGLRVGDQVVPRRGGLQGVVRV
jgi:hypothetical protein